MCDWISIKDKLPPEGKEVLVGDDEENYVVAFWGPLQPDSIYWATEKHGSSLNMNITHWAFIEPPHCHKWVLAVDIKNYEKIEEDISELYFYECSCGVRIENDETQEALTRYIDE